ncbi:MAG: nucleotidyltransferase domain-containing protein [Bacillota bacterium]
MSFNPCIKVYKLMLGFDRVWFFTGGWAIDLFIGKQTRSHQDIDIALFRNDQHSLKEYLNDWEFKKVVKGEFLSWEDEFLELLIHEVHASNKQNGNKLEILLNETDNKDWRFRRNMSI